jgi:hypothetical protein
MSTTAIVIIVVLAIIALAALAVAGLLFSRESERRHLRQQFGPEYNRTVGATGGDQKQAELDLRDRLARRKKVTLRPMSPVNQSRFTEEWRKIQATFVDSPAVAIEQADTLITQVMAERGYPMQDFDGQADLISVDYPEVVEDYRLAHGVYARSRAGAASTEEVRGAFVSYRSLFSRLVERDEGAVATASSRGSTGAPNAPTVS